MNARALICVNTFFSIVDYFLLCTDELYVLFQEISGEEDDTLRLLMQMVKNT